MTDQKIVIDAAAVGTGLGSWLALLPDVAALFSVIWLAIRIWETETVKRITGRGTE
jgi:glycerol-3-phosphate acyltransferase PlsY